jgi:hypothetical protein
MPDKSGCQTEAKRVSSPRVSNPDASGLPDGRATETNNRHGSI